VSILVLSHTYTHIHTQNIYLYTQHTHSHHTWHAYKAQLNTHSHIQFDTNTQTQRYTSLTKKPPKNRYLTQYKYPHITIATHISRINIWYITTQQYTKTCTNTTHNPAMHKTLAHTNTTHTISKTNWRSTTQITKKAGPYNKQLPSDYMARWYTYRCWDMMRERGGWGGAVCCV